MSDGLERFSVSMSAELLAQLDRMVDQKEYPSRSEALRDVIRDYLVEEQWASSEGEVIGTVTLVYDHDQRALVTNLSVKQHQHYREVISMLHVHLDRHNCLEVIVLRGKASDIRRLANQLISARGVKHGKLVCTTTGRDLP